MREDRITLILQLFKIHGPLTGFKQTGVLTMRFITELVIVTEFFLAVQLFRGIQKQLGANRHFG